MNSRPGTGAQPFLVPPHLRTIEEGGERRVSHPELFFDLVFVVAIAQLAHELVVDHSLRGFGVFAALFVPVFYAWQGFSIYADRFDTDDVAFRLVMFSAMLAVAALAIQIPDVTHGDSTGFVLAYVVLRSLMVGLYARAYRHGPVARPLTGRYVWQYALAIAAWLLSLAIPPPARYVVWAVAMMWELSVPLLARKLWMAIPLHLSHARERDALFTIIVLGEAIVVVALGTSTAEWRVSAAAVAVLGFVAAAGAWWVYFGGANETTAQASPARLAVFAFVHLPLLAALTAFSAGIALAIESASAAGLDAGTRYALAGGAALYLTCVTIVQRSATEVFPRERRRVRAAAVVVLLLVGLVGGVLDPVLFSALVTATLVALVAGEMWSQGRSLPMAA